MTNETLNAYIRIGRNIEQTRVIESITKRLIDLQKMEDEEEGEIRLSELKSLVNILYPDIKTD